MGDKRQDADDGTLASYEAALSEAGYEVYEEDGAWYYNATEYERDQNYADGPYETKGQALRIAVGNLGLMDDNDSGLRTRFN